MRCFMYIFHCYDVGLAVIRSHDRKHVINYYYYYYYYYYYNYYYYYYYGSVQ